MTEVAERTAKILEVEDGWHCITHGRFQVSVAPDGQIHLPRHLRPEDVVEDFVGAMTAAAELGAGLATQQRGPVPVTGTVVPVSSPAQAAASQLPRGFAPEALTRTTLNNSSNAGRV
jgi:hypothetical protein